MPTTHRTDTQSVQMLINRWAGLALMLNALDVGQDTHARITIGVGDLGDVQDMGITEAIEM